MPIHINNYALVYSINNGYIYDNTLMGMYTSSSYSDKRIFYSFGIGTYSTLLLLFWILQYSIHHTIIYWRIIELFK